MHFIIIPKGVSLLAQHFLDKITKACHKKQELFDKNKEKYALRSMFAGAFLTMSTACGAIAADKISHIHPDLAKFTFAFIFAFGLLYILFLNAELATSNMMYLSVGATKKYIHWQKALGILLYCTFFNLVGAYLIASLFGASSAFTSLDLHSFIANTVSSKLGKPNETVLIDAILANVFVNVAILSYLLLENQVAKIIIVLSAVFMFVYLGQEHVVANFASFGLAQFTDVGTLLPNFEFFNILRQWSLAFLGNVIGGGLVIGVSYAWLNSTHTQYKD